MHKDGVVWTSIFHAAARDVCLFSDDSIAVLLEDGSCVACDDCESVCKLVLHGCEGTLSSLCGMDGRLGLICHNRRRVMLYEVEDSEEVFDGIARMMRDCLDPQKWVPSCHFRSVADVGVGLEKELVDGLSFFQPSPTTERDRFLFRRGEDAVLWMKEHYLFMSGFPGHKDDDLAASLWITKFFDMPMPAGNEKFFPSCGLVHSAATIAQIIQTTPSAKASLEHLLCDMYEKMTEGGYGQRHIASSSMLVDDFENVFHGMFLKRGESEPCEPCEAPEQAAAARTKRSIYLRSPLDLCRVFDPIVKNWFVRKYTGTKGWAACCVSPRYSCHLWHDAALYEYGNKRVRKSTLKLSFSASFLNSHEFEAFFQPLHISLSSL